MPLGRRQPAETTTPGRVRPGVVAEFTGRAGGAGYLPAFIGVVMPQQIGVLFIMTQQVQPAIIMVDMQSQQAWIILPHSASPEVQVMTQPSLVISHLHMPMV